MRTGSERRPLSNSIRAYLSRRWEPIFFVVVFLLLLAQVYLFVSSELSVFTSTSGAAADYARWEGFIANHLAYWVSPVIFLPLFYLLACRRRPSWTRHFLDGVGIYIVVRMFVQVVGLNLLVFDSVTPRFTLITQLLFFLPYSLLVWGWIYWRRDELWGEDDRRLFQIDCEHATYRARLSW